MCSSGLFIFIFQKYFLKINFFIISIFYVFILFLCVNIKNNFLKNKKYIVLMHFQAEKTLKNNLYYTSKYTQQSDKKNPL